MRPRSAPDARASALTIAIVSTIPPDFLDAGRRSVDLMSTHLLELARHPDDRALLGGLRDALREFKRSSGSYAGLRELSQIVQAGEDLLDGLCADSAHFEAGHTDALFACLDLIAQMLDRLTDGGPLEDDFTLAADAIVTSLREQLARQLVVPELALPVGRSGTAEHSSEALVGAAYGRADPLLAADVPDWLSTLPAEILEHARSKVGAQVVLNAVRYEPTPNCFYQGEDPLFRIRRVPGLAGLHTETVSAWPEHLDFDPYRSNLRFVLLSSADAATLRQHFAGVEGSIELYAPQTCAVSSAEADCAPLDFSRRQTDRPAVRHEAGVLRIRQVRAAGQSFGLPLDHVLDSMQLPASHIHAIKGQQTAALADRVIPLYTLNALLGIPLETARSPSGGLTVVVVRVGGEQVALAVDADVGVCTVLPQAVEGRLAEVAGYDGTALLADRTLLIVLNLRELL
jgi:chemotaxis protein histidine kinase CheA